MNTRIKNLHLEAGFWASEQLPFTNPEWIELRDEKFAELLVNECLSALQTKIDEGEGYGSFELGQHIGFIRARGVIKKHFGVENEIV